MSNDKLAEIIRSLGYTTQRQTAEIVAAIRAYEAEKQAGPVAGWKLVPVEPTLEMIAASDDISMRAEGRDHWAAMLAAAPPSPLSEQGKEDAELLDWLGSSNWYIGPEYSSDEAGCISGYENQNCGDLRAAIRAARAKKEQQ